LLSVRDTIEWTCSSDGRDKKCILKVCGECGQ